MYNTFKCGGIMININSLLNINKNLSVLSSYSDRFILCSKNENVATFDANFKLDKCILNDGFFDLYETIFNTKFVFKKSNVDFQIIAICIIIDKIINSNDYIIFDDILTYLDLNNKKLILKYLKDKGIRVINFTSDSEELLIYSYLVVINDGAVVYKGYVKDVLLNEYELKSYGFNLPFIVDLSLQLKSYGLLNSVFYNEKKLRDELWN